ncbi:MAG TPA: NifB/NifX family molybdenum-iron cluster-binding protein [Cellulomonas sp.]|nr:NifB/NifX family molybdenum-iron cluster-binding protein [Cellulomonas sp.]
MIVCIPVTEDGRAGGGWGRAHRVALATASAGTITDWQEVEVGWDTAHNEGTEGSHHARIARFLIDHHVDAVVTGHMGPPMARMLHTMGIRTSLDADGDARAAVLAALDTLTGPV